MTERVMVDLETLGTDPGAVILSIGAVRFDEVGLSDEFYKNVSIQSCVDAGLEIDADTLDWWLGQDDEVQDVLQGGVRLSKALAHFSAFYRGADEIWAFSPTFDCQILSAAYDAIDEPTPWNYRDERDCRTLAALPAAADVEQQGDAHDALDDAVYQARTVVETLDRLDTNSEGGESDGE
ncbi:3'-5' exonuclease [Haloarcula pellucida]|uniref:3'-5' exoribonuclease Rv2179c-like domain-containing protein n=1 Tax=Haloarcula pellucida TaxID=1427151 RepID=A0A830GSD1_9EURY|nr:3'-5' exonuclease [Halomicroarcula pellucida]MBX0350513.1 3'-5' exoribonuclease [Halomicroarcula pellucida]GGO03681.1 hypothetical protein GCM10009030_39590 [Halomicroarcula pellucida]